MNQPVLIKYLVDIGIPPSRRMTMASAAEKLKGVDLDGGWTVGDQIDLTNTTGCSFSTSYYVHNVDGSTAFLKALDYSVALASLRPAEMLQVLVEEYLFERRVVERCSRRMDRVVKALAAGTVRVDNEPAEYLIFELADQDVRVYLDLANQIDIAWILRSLHHVATGLKQLHSAGIAHQDLKPSNVVVFNGSISKLADLGRAAYKGHSPPHDNFIIPGDPDYSPPELLYGYADPDWTKRRFGCDAYHLGSLTVFFFTRVNMTVSILNRLHVGHLPGNWTGTFDEVLPYLRDAFGHALDDFGRAVERINQNLRDPLTEIVGQLCDPDPRHRGHPKIQKASNPFFLERYVERFNLLASRANIGRL
jgi:serine/threonine protein kinase